MFSKVVIASVGSEGAGQALPAAVRLAKKHDAVLLLVSAEELPQFPASVDEVIEGKDRGQAFQQTCGWPRYRQVRAEGVKLASHLGHTIKTIVELSRASAATYLWSDIWGPSSVYNRIIGSATDRLVGLASCAVLVVKRSESATLRRRASSARAVSGVISIVIFWWCSSAVRPYWRRCQYAHLVLRYAGNAYPRERHLASGPLGTAKWST
jgi:nucleotide-binding universal stress UspA family protein